jgi:hypothetical protein
MLPLLLLLLWWWWWFWYASALTFFRKSERGLGALWVLAGVANFGVFVLLCFPRVLFPPVRLLHGLESWLRMPSLLPVTDFQHFFVEYLFIYLFILENEVPSDFYFYFFQNFNTSFSNIFFFRKWGSLGFLFLFFFRISTLLSRIFFFLKKMRFPRIFYFFIYQNFNTSFSNISFFFRKWGSLGFFIF